MICFILESVSEIKNMEIRFIWIEEYREIIEKLNVNFNHDGNHRFNYLNGELELMQNNKSVLDFGPNIKGITAIAGKNGSGKSSICEVLLNAAATYVNGAWGWNEPFKGIVCYGKRIFISKDLALNNKEQIIAAGYEILTFEESPLERLPIGTRNEFHKVSFLYYSNVLDWRSDIDLTNLTNISTHYLLANDYRTGTSKVPDFRRRDNVPNIMNSYYNGQGYRNTKFYLHFSDIIPFDEPKQFMLKSAYSGLNKYLNYTTLGEYEQYSPFVGLERQILDSIQDFHGPITHGVMIQTNKELAKEAIMNLYRFNFLMVMAINARELPNFQLASNFTLGITDNFDLFPNPAEAEKLISLHEQIVAAGLLGDEFSPYFLHDRYPDFNWKFFIIEHLWMNNTPELRNLLKSFLDLEEHILRGNQGYTKRKSDYSMHPWPSTGESSYYLLFSRLYDAITRYDIGVDDRENLVLFIDEGEVGFHPAWKKKYLKWILDFLNGDYNKYKFQIILTTHSPYILSDLSSDHTLLLKRNKGEKTKIVPSENYMTFGANINDLLADAFFLTDGQIGEFAKQKIQTIIDRLNRWRRIKSELPRGSVLQIEQQEKDECLNIIELIGDMIVRKKLFEMYLELFDDEGIVDQEMLFLEKRLNQLRERKMR